MRNIDVCQCAFDEVKLARTDGALVCAADVLDERSDDKGNVTQRDRQECGAHRFPHEARDVPGLVDGGAADVLART